jgi:hypothetical protein
MTPPRALVGRDADAFALTSPSSAACRCGKCGKRVIVAQSGLRLLRQRPTMEILCAQCYCASPNPVLASVIGAVADDAASLASEIRAAMQKFWRKQGRSND